MAEPKDITAWCEENLPLPKGSVERPRPRPAFQVVETTTHADGNTTTRTWR